MPGRPQSAFLVELRPSFVLVAFWSGRKCEIQRVPYINFSKWMLFIHRRPAVFVNTATASTVDSGNTAAGSATYIAICESNDNDSNDEDNRTS